MICLRFILTLFIAASCALYAAAQENRVISGIVKDEYNHEVSKANILIYDSAKKAAIAYAISNTEGLFSASIKNNCRKLLVKVTRLGYTDTIITVRLAENSGIFLSLNIFSSKNTLPEVTVRAVMPIIEKGDTTVFNISRFNPESERKTEDILKKLPGISVDENGRLKFKNKVISKVLIEGDDLFGSNYTMLTQNLDAAALSQVEAIENAADNAVLKNFDFSRQTILNLKLKKKYLYRLFGDVTAMAGGQNFEGNANLFALMNKYKSTVLSGTNNTGKNSSARAFLQNQKILPYLSEDQYHIQTPAGFAPQLINPVKAPGVPQKRFNRNEDSYVQANLLTRPFKKIEVKSGIGISGINDRLNSNRTIDFLNAPMAGSLVEYQLYREHARYASGSFSAIYTDADRSRLEASINTCNQVSMVRSQLSGSKNLAETREQQAFSLNGKIKYSVKTGRHSAINVEGVWQGSRGPVEYTADTLLNRQGKTQGSYLSFQFNNPVSFAGLSLAYFNKQKNAAGTEYEWNIFSGFSETFEKTRSFLAGDGLLDYGLFTAPGVYSYQLNAQRYWLGAKASAKTKDFTFTFIPKAEYAVYRSQSISTGNPPAYRYQLLPQPSLSVRKRVGKNKNLQVGYFYRQTLPDILEMQNGPVLLDYRTVFSYNSLSYTSTQHNVSLQYCNAAISKGHLFLAGLTYSWQRNGYQYSYLNFSGYNEQFKVKNDQPVKMVNFFAAEELTLPSLSTFLNIKYSGAYSSGFNNINTTESKQKNLFSSVELSARTAFPFPVNITGNFLFLNNRQLSSIGTRTVSNYKWSTGINCISKDKKFLLKMNYDEYRYRGLSTSRFVDAVAEYRITKNRLTLNMSITNLFNETKAASMLLLPDQQTEATYPVLPRMILAGVNLRF